MTQRWIDTGDLEPEDHAGSLPTKLNSGGEYSTRKLEASQRPVGAVEEGPDYDRLVRKGVHELNEWLAGGAAVVVVASLLAWWLT